MADTAVAVTNASYDTLSADLRAGGTTVASGATAVIGCGGDLRRLMIFISGTGGGDSVINIEAGTEPPSELAGLGASGNITIDDDETYVLIPTPGRYIKSDDGALEFTVATHDVVVRAIRMPFDG